MAADHVVIIGASLAGLRTAEGLRRAGHTGAITVVGDETHLPYTRPPLSKQVLAGDWEADKVLLRPQDKLDELQLEWRLGVRATGLDTVSRVVTLSDGELGYDALVVATGARARPFPGVGPLGGLHVLRTLDDALALRAELVQGTRIVIIGGGFIGAEAASAAKGRGLAVTIVEPLAAPMVRGLGPELGAVAAELIRGQGVEVRLGVGVEAIESDTDELGVERVTGVRLGDGTTVPADVVLVGIGAIPNTEWLEGSGLTVDNGVVCDGTLAAVGVERVWAAGDVARWRHPSYDQPVRFEHWTVAADHGQAVAGNIVAVLAGATPEVHGPVPYVWSDQFGVKIQIIGRAADDDGVELLTGAIEDHKFLAARTRNGLVTGAVGFSQPRQLVQLQMRMEQGPLTVEEARTLVNG